MSDCLHVFAGKDVGASALRFLLDRGDPVAYVVAGKRTDEEILDLAVDADIPHEVYSDETQARLKQMPCHWLLSLWFPHILRKPILQSARFHLNLHPSLVPHCRGSDGAAWALRLRLPAGVSLLEMNEDIDAAPVWAQVPVEYGVTTRGSELLALLKDRLLELFKEQWVDIYGGKVEPTRQMAGGSSFKRAQTNRDRCRDGTERDTLENFIWWALAHDHAPHVTSEVTIDGRLYKVTLNVEAV